MEKSRSGGKWKSEWTFKNRFSMVGCGKGKKRGIANVVSTIHYFLSLSLSPSLSSRLWRRSRLYGKVLRRFPPIFREKNLGVCMPSGHFRDCEIPASSSASSSKASQEIGEGPPPSLAETFLRLGHPPSPYNPGFQTQAKAPPRWEERRRRRTFFPGSS